MLQHYKFLEKHLPLVRAMQCVPIPIEMEVFDWIRADAGGRGALDDIEKRNSEVWLYTETFDGTETAIGFAGYAPKKWNWPDADGPRVKHFHITNLGLDERYRGQPPGAREDRYAWQILDHLVNVCMNRIEADASFSPMLSLNVEQNNLRAISFYQQYGFNFLPRQIYIDEATGREYPGMIFRF